MAAEEVEEVEETESKSKLPVILGALAVFVLGGGAGFGGSMLMGGSDAEASEEGGEEGEEGEEAPVEDPRAVHDLGMFTVNLRGSGGGRVLRMEVSLETTEAGLPTVVEREAQLRDTVITLVSDYNYADLEGLDGKTRLRDELLGRVNTLMPAESRVERIYFTQFVVQ